MWGEKKGRSKMWGENLPNGHAKNQMRSHKPLSSVHVVYVASPSTSDPYAPLLLPHERLICSWHPLATAAIYTSLDTHLDKHRGLMQVFKTDLMSLRIIQKQTCQQCTLP